MTLISVRRLGKKYKRYPDQRARLLEWLSAGHAKTHDPIWVLRDLSFEVEPGEAVGIIGENGAGKSTLLKMLNGSTQPTEGEIRIRGRVAALLELGMGFHPEFTGRQNAITSCQIMGLRRAEIQRLMPAIEAFSELGDYMDQPLRTYSSGMQVRLAFSVAAAVRPEILIIDEALSVGDVYFQHKSMSRIREFKDLGTTLLFVSHDPGAVKSLCDRALLLDKGLLIKDGAPDSILDYYNAMIARREKDEEIRQVESETGKTGTRSGNKKATILAVDMLDQSGEPTRAFRVGEHALIRCKVRYNEPVSGATVGLLIRDRLGNDIFGTNTYHLGQDLPAGPGEVWIEYRLALNLGRGNYSVSVASHSRDVHVGDSHDWWDQAAVFQIVPSDAPSFAGVAALPVEVTIRAPSATGMQR
ncbi:MAG: ABC transporter ATP-binding protein [Pseudomonadota bacterium]|nr:ABC transporter ATP-binding protein [Pseudomonadota bacterium]